MPWFPDFYNAIALARIQTRTSGHADPVHQYFDALLNGDSDALETSWPGEVAVYDPSAGEVRGTQRPSRFRATESDTAGGAPRADGDRCVNLF